jgi:Zn-dependent M28 family amino/carboxypeptidase
MKFTEKIAFMATLCAAFLIISLEALMTEISAGRENLYLVSGKSIIETVDDSRLRKSIAQLQSLGNRITWEKQWEAANWVSGEFKKVGVEVGIHTYEFNGKTWPNVVAEIRGRKLPGEIIMPIAHIDSISDSPQKMAPGADDNGSGVAVILEMARVLKETPMERTVMFGIFTNEEPGSVGSKAYARQASKDGLDIKSVINLDILGYNRPAWPFYWDAVQAHATVKHKMKAIIRMVRNYLTGVIKGKDILIVAGKDANRDLVSMTAQIIRDSSGLKVKEMVGEDCG